MEDIPSELPSNCVGTESTEARFLRCLITVFKDNRDALPSIPEMIECLITNGGDALNRLTVAHVSREEDRTSTEKESTPKDNVEAIKKETKLVEERIQSLEAELEENRKEISEKEKKMLKMEKDIEEKLSIKKKAEIQELFDKYSTSYGKVKTKNDALKKDIQQKDEEIQRYSQRVQSLEAELEKREKGALIMEQQHSQSLSKMSDDLKAAYSKMDGYKSRLASLSEKRVKQDQRLVEDTLSSNRQSELESDFSAFFDNERLDACEKMQKIYQNKEEDYLYIYYPRLACIILESSYEKAKETNEVAIDLFMELTKSMVENAAQMGHLFLSTRRLSLEGKYQHGSCTVPITAALWGEGVNYPRDTIDGLTVAVKEAADNCNLDFLLEHVFLLAFDKWKKWCVEDKTCMFTPAWNVMQGLEKYIKACIRLTWRMVTQVPPMKLEYKFLKYDKQVHKKIGYNKHLKARPRTRLSAEQDQDEEIVCYLWPGLQDGGGRQIRLGEVLC